MTKPVAESPTAPLGVRVLLLALLPLIALALYLDGQRYDPDRVQLKPRQTGPAAELFPETLAGLGRAGPVRHYTKDSLYEYINGHAEYFLSAGFKGLAVGEYGPSGRPSLVVNLYDLGEPLNAFGALADEAGEREALDLGTLAFAVGKGVSFIRGPYYVQIHGFEPDLPLLEGGRALDGNLARQVPAAGLVFQFPDLGPVKATRYIKEAYQGLDFLSQVLERRFDHQGVDLRVFLATGTQERIQGLVTAFETQFRQDRVDYQRLERGPLTYYLVKDPYEGDWLFVPLAGRLLGVFGALDEPLDQALQTWAARAPEDAKGPP